MDQNNGCNTDWDCCWNCWLPINGCFAIILYLVIGLNPLNIGRLLYIPESISPLSPTLNNDDNGNSKSKSVSWSPSSSTLSETSLFELSKSISSE